MHNFHLPLAEGAYRDLHEDAERSSKPATALARQAIEMWLRHRRRVARHEAIAAFAAEHASGPLDLNAALERASIDYLVTTEGDER